MFRSALTALLATCLLAAPTAAKAAPDSTAAREGAPAAPAPPLTLFDDLGFGATVVLSRIPTLADLDAIHYVSGVARVLVDLPGWPAGWDRLQAMAQMPLPDGAEYVVLVRGYPPTRAAAEAWNQTRAPIRLIVLVDGPPADRGAIQDLNSIRALERVIADMPVPSRAGFERLQRPLSFRVIRP